MTDESIGAVWTASSTHARIDDGVALNGFAAVASLNFWLPANCEAKFMRASIAPVENQDSPSDHPDTFGGSYRIWPMLDNGVSASDTENPTQPISLSARGTNSAGHE